MCKIIKITKPHHLCCVIAGEMWCVKNVKLTFNTYSRYISHVPNLRSIQYQSLTPEYLQESIVFMENEFWRVENISRVFGIPHDRKALLETRELTTAVAKEGISLIAVDKTLNKIVGACLNKIHVKGNDIFENFSESWKEKRSKDFARFMFEIDNMCDFGVDCIYEPMFMATSPLYSKKGIARNMVGTAVEIGRSLAKNTDSKPRPDLIMAVFTTVTSHRIAQHFGFTDVFQKNYSELEYEGMKFSDVIGEETTQLTIGYIQL